MSRIVLVGLLLGLAACGTDETAPTAPHPHVPITTVGIVSAPGAGMTPALGGEIRRLEQRHPAGDGRRLISEVVHVGCLTARTVTLSVVDDRVSVTAHVLDQDIECITALTSAVVLDVPEGYGFR